MKQAILQILPPQKDAQGSITHKESQALSKISDKARDSLKRIEGFEQLGEYAWLCPLETSLQTLSEIVCLADIGGLSYRVAFMENELQWMTYDKKEDNS
jgi:hypothetical protein